jgi:hypothetical protein
MLLKAHRSSLMAFASYDMPRTLLALGSLLLLAGSAQAQWGLRAGLNASTLHSASDSYELQARTRGGPGYQAGVFYEKPLGARLSLVPELQLSRQQTTLDVADYRVSDGSYQANYRLRLLYLHVPVLLRVRLGRVFLEAGPQASVLQAAHEKGTEVRGSIIGSSTTAIDRPATDRYRRLDAGLSAGLGVQLPSGFGLSLRAYQGLLSATREWEVYHYGGRLTNRSVQAALSYQLAPKS